MSTTQAASGEQVQPMEQREDPTLAPSLQMLDDHVSAHSKHLQPMATDLVAHLEDLVRSVEWIRILPLRRTLKTT